MAKISFIQFRAFDKPMQETFFDKDEKTIHAELLEICGTAEITRVSHYSAELIEHKPTFDFLTQTNH